MCDNLIRRNVPEADHPEYVYKRVQKVGDNKYISPVMGEPMPFGEWLKAPSRDIEVVAKKAGGQRYYDLINLIKRKWKKKGYAGSSSFDSLHNGMWGSFAYQVDAKNADLISNFMDTKTHDDFPTVVVKCEVKGTVHETRYTRYDAYLTSHIKIVEELEAVQW